MNSFRKIPKVTKQAALDRIGLSCHAEEEEEEGVI
jgi:hypothetical protein